MSAIKTKLLFRDKINGTIALSELGELKNGYAFKSNTYCDKGQYKIITIANVTGDRYINYKECNHVETIPNDIKKHQILNCNDILISLTGNVGRVSLNAGSDNLLNQRVGLFKIKADVFREYIYQVLSTKQFENDMKNKGQGAAQMNIGKSDIEEYEIPFCDDKNLLFKISNILYLIECKIINANDVLSQYRFQKQYLLQQMFI